MTDPVRSEIRAMLARAHERPEAEFDHESLTVSLMVTADQQFAFRGVNRVWPIGRHSVVEYVRERDGEQQIAYAALEAL